jgi:RNA polymerase sigma factor (sigma-70 family)
MKDELTKLLPALRRFSYSLSNSVHDADDLLQATLERILDKGVPEDVELIKWAFRVCRNLWIDEFRAQKTRQNAALAIELQGHTQFDGERHMHKQMELNEVNQAMQELPEDQHMVLSMVAVHGLSYKNVAEALDIPLGTVMSRLARARVNLTSRLNAPANGGL